MSTTKFESKTVKSGEFTSVTFDSILLNAGVALQSFSMSFGVSVDHHIREVIDEASITSSDDRSVGVSVIATMEDNSQNLAKGEATLLVLGECEA